MKSKVIYLIQGSRGSYSDKTDWNVTALIDEGDATRLTALMNELVRKVYLLDRQVFGAVEDKVPIYEVSKVPLPSAEVREAAGLSRSWEDLDFAKLVEELGV